MSRISCYLSKATALLITAGFSLSVMAIQPVVQQLTLEQLCDRADRIVRGTVMNFHTGTIQAGGVDLPTVTYTIAVAETLKGPARDKTLEITSLGVLKASADQGEVRRLGGLPELPKYTIGQEYLLMTTAPSSIGLSTTVGLGQGLFVIAKDKQQTTANQLSNLGLSAAINSPVPYAELAGTINSALQP